MRRRKRRRGKVGGDEGQEMEGKREGGGGEGRGRGDAVMSHMYLNNNFSVLHPELCHIMLHQYYQ